MPNIASFANAWKSGCAEYQAMTGKAAPIEAVKKCWLRSNKTLSLAFEELDAAFQKFEREHLSSRIPAKVLAANIQAVKKKLESVKKLAPAHLFELEEEYAEALAGKKTQVSGADRKLHTQAVKFLKRELQSLLAVAESKCANVALYAAKHGAAVEGLARAALLFEKQMVANIAKGYAIAARLKAAATAARTPAQFAKVVDAYNSGIVQNAGRDINVLTVGLMKHCQKEPSAQRHLAPVQAFYEFTKPWNNPDTHKLPATAAPAQLLAKLKEFAAMLKKSEIFPPRVMKDFL